MKRLLLILAGVAVTVLPYTVTTYADEMTKDMKTGKDECLIVAKNCGNDVDSVFERIHRIKGEIARGTDVYTADELKALNRELNNNENLLNYLKTDSPPAGPERL